jgi:hypothetical protein
MALLASRQLLWTLLPRDTVWPGRQLPTFRRKLLPASLQYSAVNKRWHVLAKRQ